MKPCVMPKGCHNPNRCGDNNACCWEGLTVIIDARKRVQDQSWATKQVLQCCNVNPDEAEDWQIDLAEQCLEECYYIQLAAERYMDLKDIR